MSKKDEIIRASTSLFYEKGYHSTTMNDLAKEVGTTKAALYYYFKGKEELLVRIYEETIRDSVEQISEIANSGLSTTEKIREIIRNHIKNFIIKRQPMMKIFFQEEGELPSKIYKSIQRKKRNYNKIFEDVYSKGVEEGVFIRTSNVALHVNAILGMCTWAYKWYKPDGRFDPEEMSDHFVKLLEEGYLVSKKKESDQFVSPPDIDGRGVSDSDSTSKGIIDRIQFHASIIEQLTRELNNILNKESTP
ncbi:MAG: TetR/AcrR family transcriptional regulator [Thermodesulfobacteriota bacterium]